MHVLSLRDQINLFSTSSICKAHQFSSTEKMLSARFLKLVLVTATLVIDIARPSRTAKITPTSATQSSGGSVSALKAIGGLLDTTSHISHEFNPWLRIQLGNDFYVDKVIIYNRNPMERLFYLTF